MSRAVFPGSFDPVTLGHLHLIRRAARLYDEVIVVIAVNSQKHALFTAEERRALIEENIRGMGNVRVDTAEGLLVRKVRELGAQVIIRGIRCIGVQQHHPRVRFLWRRHPPLCAGKRGGGDRAKI